jgi:iron complex outermembrane receptor protein
VATFPGYFTAEPYYDIASLEVLRGPQGTFVGQNATGGAVFVTTNDPKIGGGYNGYIAGQIGNYSDVAAQGAINLPLGDTLAARVSFNAEQRDSFYDITGPGTGNDGVKMGSVRLGLLWQPTDALKVNFKVDYSHLDFGGYPSDPVNSTNDPFDLTANTHMAARDWIFRTVLKADYEFGNGIVLRSISGYQDGNTYYVADLDGTSVGTSTFRDSVDETSISQEFNLISPDGERMSWVLGAYYQFDKLKFPTGDFVIGVPPGSIFSEYVLQGTNPKENKAIFGQVTFKLPHRFELQLGARYSESETRNNVSVLQYGLPIVQTQTAGSDNVSGKISLNWTVDDHNFLYAFVATGYKPGGLNVPVGAAALDPFGPEKVTNYEIGWKAGFFGGRLRTQMNVYYNDYEDFQVSIGYPLFPVFSVGVNNPGTTKIYGFEAQAEAVFGQLSIDAGLGWMKSELGVFYATDPRGISGLPCDPATGPASVSCINLGGRDQTYAPELTFNIGGQYQFNLANGDTLTPRLNYGFVSEQWATLFQNRARGDRVEERNVINAQLAWTRGDIVTTLYATNLADEHYVAAINSGLRFAGPPRQFGLRVMKVF